MGRAIATLVVILGALVVVWLAFVVFVFLARPDGATLRDAARLLPDVFRLVRRLATDRTIPRRTRWLLWALVVYLASPIDIVPDFVPVIGYADDAIITAWVVRRVIKTAGADKLAAHWPGTPDGLQMLTQYLRLESR
jgi:uncharacterized membrane protein YkvA (DUF1232 family)